MSQLNPDEAELLELVELAKIGAEKAKKLYEIAQAIALKYKIRAHSKLFATEKQKIG